MTHLPTYRYCTIRQIDVKFLSLSSANIHCVFVFRGASCARHTHGEREMLHLSAPRHRLCHRRRCHSTSGDSLKTASKRLRSLVLPFIQHVPQRLVPRAIDRCLAVQGLVSERRGSTSTWARPEPRRKRALFDLAKRQRHAWPSEHEQPN